MNFLTDRKRAEGLGAGGHGAQGHWKMIATSLMIAVLLPLSIIIFGCALGNDQATVAEYYGRPFPAIVTALTLIVGITHFKMEVDEAVEDYVGGIKRKLTLIAVAAFSYALMASGLFALVKLAL